MSVNIDDELRTVLLTLSAVTDVVGTRIYPDVFPQTAFSADLTTPAILIEVDNEESSNDLSGTSDRRFGEVTITCRATTHAAASALAESVRTNDTDPGTGLAGPHRTNFDAWHEDTAVTPVPAPPGKDPVYWDAVATYRATWTEVR